MGTVKAIQTVADTIENPSVTIRGKKIVFPVRMISGMYLEFKSIDDCKLYGAKGELLKDVIPVGTIPDMINGDNEIVFSCDSRGKVNNRVQVTVISEGKPLVKK